MARSLTVKHEEAPKTSRLLNWFLILAVTWMALTTLATSSEEIPPPAVQAFNKQ